MPRAPGAPQMATRFDRVTSHHRPRSTEHTDERARVRPPPVLERPATTPRWVSDAAEGRVLPVRPLAAAMSTWLAAVWMVCYVAVPALFTAGGLTSANATTVAAVPAFVLASFATTIGVLCARPAIRLAVPGLRDPVLAAVLGSLAVWVATQNGVPGLLLPFSAMTWGELGAVTAVNGLEACWLGVMFASFTRSTGVAFALGAGFKLVLMGVALALLAVLA